MVERSEAQDRETSWGPPGEVGRQLKMPAEQSLMVNLTSL
jgi:hypothetical protein